jgi:hypothetical protein
LNLVAPSSARFWRVAGRASKYHLLYTIRYYTSLVWVWGLHHTYYGTTLASMYSNTIHTRIRMRRMSDAAHHRIQQIFHHVNPAIATCRSSINRQTARQVHSHCTAIASTSHDRKMSSSSNNQQQQQQQQHPSDEFDSATSHPASITPYNVVKSVVYGRPPSPSYREWNIANREETHRLATEESVCFVASETKPNDLYKLMIGSIVPR